MVIKNFAFLLPKMERSGNFLNSFNNNPSVIIYNNSKILWCILEFLFVTIQILSPHINDWMILKGELVYLKISWFGPEALHGLNTLIAKTS